MPLADAYKVKSKWKGNDQEPIQPNSTPCPKREKNAYN